MLQGMEEEEQDKTLRKVFDKFDTDKNGFIDREELCKFV